MKVLSTVFSALSETKYGSLPKPIPAIINYALDSYFHKLSSLNKSQSDDLPADPNVDIKEKWLGCEIHKFIILNQDYPSFARPLNAHAFAMLFYPYGGEMAEYQIVPFLDKYEFKNLIRNAFEWRLQQESFQISPDTCQMLPVYGTFFIIEKSTGKRLIVKIDLCYESMGCKFTICCAPSDKALAERFLNNLNASRISNDIYFKQCLSYVNGSLSFTSANGVSWQDIILNQGIKNDIIKNSLGILEKANIYTDHKIKPSRNILLISPPGMAKTTIFKAICNESVGKNTVIWCTGKSIRDAHDVTSLFEAAKSLAPAIVLIEDMDLFGRDRDESVYRDSNILNEFLACLDGTFDNSGIIVMASTNDVACMDEALINRPGRFDLKIEIPLPDKSERVIMLESFCASHNCIIMDKNKHELLDKLADITSGLSGAYIKDLIKTAVISAVSNNAFLKDGKLFLTRNDLISASQQILKNFEIGSRSKKHHILDN